MKDFTNPEAENLRQLAKIESKHSTYQSIHPSLLPIIGDNYHPDGKYEKSRFDRMQTLTPMSGKNILDIGANTGYFSISASEAGAEHVTAIEGNDAHAHFIHHAANLLGFSQKLKVENKYFNFSENLHPTPFDITFCLNVVHHLGDDFGDPCIDLKEAKQRMLDALNKLATWTRLLWFQMGYNWKGDRTKPIFEKGTKPEMLNFIKSGISDHWEILDISAINPKTSAYESLNDFNIQRFDALGEFANRPLLLLSSKASKS